MPNYITGQNFTPRGKFSRCKGPGMKRLHQYFKPSLPSPSGPLAHSLASTCIKDANEAVKDVS